MAFKRILVHLDASPRCAARAEAAAELAGRLGASLTGLYAINSAEIGHQGGLERRDVVADLAQETLKMFRRCTEACGVSAGWRQAMSIEAEQVNTNVIMAARHHDLSVVGQSDSTRIDLSVPGDLVDQVVDRSGRPVLIIPFAGRFPVVGQRVVVAWNGSREAARALADAMPLLKTAKKVIVLRLADTEGGSSDTEPEVSDLSEYLVTHGISPLMDRLNINRAAIGISEALLSYLAEEAADLLVMGGGGAVRARPAKSLTNDIVRQMTVPLMVSR